MAPVARFRACRTLWRRADVGARGGGGGHARAVHVVAGAAVACWLRDRVCVCIVGEREQRRRVRHGEHSGGDRCRLRQDDDCVDIESVVHAGGIRRGGVSVAPVAGHHVRPHPCARDECHPPRAVGFDHHDRRVLRSRICQRLQDHLRRAMLQDLRFGCRMLRRNPGFSILAVVCLTVGIGATAAVFSWIEGILLRPFPLVVDQDRLVAVVGTNRGSERTDVSWPDFQDLQRAATLADAFIAEKITGTTLSIGDRAERAPGSIVSANYFDAIGVRPMLGRGFEPGEDSGRNAHPVAVISYQMWQDRFRGDPAVIGKTQVLAGLPHTIVGVAPKGFYGTFVGYAFQFWVPASMQTQFDGGVYKLEDRGARWIEGYVRLKPGVTIDQEQAEVSAIAARLEAAYPETNRGRSVKLSPLWATPFNGAASMLPALGVALVVVLAVLLTACANVGNLLLVRAFARQQEMTIRLSL